MVARTDIAEQQDSAGHFVVHPDRVSNAFVGLGLIFFIALTFLAVGVTQWQDYHSIASALALWLLASGALVCGVWLVREAIIRRPLLLVDQDGLTTPTGQLPWSDIGEIRVVKSELVVQRPVRPDCGDTLLNTAQIPGSDKALEDIAARIESCRPPPYRRPASPRDIAQPTHPASQGRTANSFLAQHLRRILVVIDRFRLARKGTLFVITAVIMMLVGSVIDWAAYRDHHEWFEVLVLMLVSVYWLSAGLAAALAGVRMLRYVLSPRSLPLVDAYGVQRQRQWH